MLMQRFSWSDITFTEPYTFFFLLENINGNYTWYSIDKVKNNIYETSTFHQTQLILKNILRKIAESLIKPPAWWKVGACFYAWCVTIGMNMLYLMEQAETNEVICPSHANLLYSRTAMAVKQATRLPVQARITYGESKAQNLLRSLS